MTIIGSKMVGFFGVISYVKLIYIFYIFFDFSNFFFLLLCAPWIVANFRENNTKKTAAKAN